MRRFLLALAALFLSIIGETALAAEPVKTLRYAFTDAETSFDPPRIADVSSRTITAHIFEALYTFDPLARPSRVVPLIAAGEPAISADYKVFTIKVRPGIYFANDPAFKGQPREVTADDFVYSVKRFADPATNAQGWVLYEEAGIVGLAELRQRAIDAKKPFPYEAPVAGLKALDRYTLQVRTAAPRPRLIESIFAGNDLFGAVAREVVEFYGDRIGEHPVGTGPYRLKQWRRSSQIVLERNADYRERFYTAQPAPDDLEGQTILARLKGRRIPMIDQVIIDIIEASQPRWLSFLNREHDLIQRVPEDFIPQISPNNVLVPALARRGMHAVFTAAPDVTMTCFNLADPVIGGTSPEKVALRRAISLAYDVGKEIRLIRRGQGLPAQSPIVPNTSGYDPAFKSEMSDYDPARAKALLDMYGYVDRDGDGWREMPDGRPLVLTRNSEPTSVARGLDELWESSLRAVGIRLQIRVQQWPANFKAAQAANFQMWQIGSTASSPDGQEALLRYYGPAAGTVNLPRFKDARLDALFDRMQALPDGAERDRLFHEAKRITVALMPYKLNVHRVYTDIEQPWLHGFRRPLFWLDFWQFVDVDVAGRSAAGR